MYSQSPPARCGDAPTRICGGPAAAAFSTVYDVVVDERGAVQEFDYGGEANGSGTIFTGVGVGEQEQRGAQRLPPPPRR